MFNCCLMLLFAPEICVCAADGADGGGIIAIGIGWGMGGGCAGGCACCGCCCCCCTEYE